MRIRQSVSLLIPAVLMFSLLSGADETTFSVRHDHLFGGCHGQLTFDAEGIRFESSKEDHSRSWAYQDIQQLQLDPSRVAVLTYRDRMLHLGRDETFRFDLTDGHVTDALRVTLQERLSRPLVSSVLPAEETVLFRISVKHRKAFRGTEGMLEISENHLAYRTDPTGGSRIWRYDELLSVGSTGPFQLRVTAMERTGGEYGGGKNFIFDLKERLPAPAYDFLWNRIHRPRIDGRY